MYARVVDGRTLYVNTTGASRDIAIDRVTNGVLTGKRWPDVLGVNPMGGDLLEK